MSRRSNRARAISSELEHANAGNGVSDGAREEFDIDYGVDPFYPDPYSEGIAARGLKVVAERAFGDYQGDLVFIVSDSIGRTGVAIAGYSSCSGCDALQACSSQEEYDLLLDAVVNSIFWGTEEALRGHLASGLNWWNTESAGLHDEIEELLLEA